MTAKRIIHTRPDGGVSITVPSPHYIANLIAGGMTEDEAVQSVLAKDVPANDLNPEVVDVSALSADREFRNTWVRPDTGLPKVDMSKARDIHAGRIAIAQVAEIARLKVAERSERLKGNTVQADAHAATVTALEALDLNVLAIQIAAAPNPVVLQAVWPTKVPR